MDVIPHLLAFVSEDFVFPLLDIAANQITQETVKLNSRMIGPGKAPSAQAARGHTEVTPIFLHHNVRGHFGCAEQRMLRLLDGERLRNTLRISRIIELKARLALPHPDGIR